MAISCAHLETVKIGLWVHEGFLHSAENVRRGVVPTIPQGSTVSNLSITNPCVHADRHAQTQRNWPWLVQIRRPSLEGFSQRGLWGRGSTDVGAASRSANTPSTVQWICVCTAWVRLLMCVYSLLHNGRVGMRGVKESVPHLIGCWLMIPPWAAFSWVHTCPAKQRNVRDASLQKKGRDRVWMRNIHTTIQRSVRN